MITATEAKTISNSFSKEDQNSNLITRELVRIEDRIQVAAKKGETSIQFTGFMTKGWDASTDAMFVDYMTKYGYNCAVSTVKSTMSEHNSIITITWSEPSEPSEKVLTSEKC